MRRIKKLRQKLAERAGMTLIEVIVSVAILAMVCLIAATALLSAGNIIRRGADIKAEGQKAAANIEQQKATGGVDESQAILVGGYKFKGATAKVTEKNVSYSIFVPSIVLPPKPGVGGK